MSTAPFYDTTISAREDSRELQHCMEQTVQRLLQSYTEVEKPGMLLGKIQSGKTRAFIGVIALAFDKGYDMAIVLTKGTKVLTRQTYERLKKDLKDFVDDDKIQISDIMHLPKNFTKFELQQKLVIVVKKEINNLKRIIKALTETYPELGRKRLLIVDDEADYASIGFRRSQQEGIRINKISSQINKLRQQVASSDFLQVTATPYSLYLQPEHLAVPTEHTTFKPIRPAFTVLCPEYDGYVGGDFYFVESEDENSVASDLYEEVSIEELHVLHKEDRRAFRIETVLDSPKIKILRTAIMNFLVGACTVKLLQREEGQREKKYSFIVHTEHSRASHAWQERIVRKLIELLESSAINDSDGRHLVGIVREAYNDFGPSIQKAGKVMPTFENVKGEVLKALREGHVMVTKVNSETEAEQLLDENGQLKLRTPLNIFIGGQILDRGVTVDNLIGFYYGRRPARYQQDTVLQHSRMYGDRPLADLAVTRFYTAYPIYETMQKIHEFDTALRDVLAKHPDSAEVVFIRKDPSDRIIPCSPNKILLSSITTLRPYKRMLPIGFQTLPKGRVEEVLKRLDKTIMDCCPKDDRHNPFLLDVHMAKLIIGDISDTLEFAEGFVWDVKAFEASIEYLSETAQSPTTSGRIWCLVRTDRYAKRKRPDTGRFFNAPDTAHQEGVIAKQVATELPILMLFRQNGRQEDGWRGSPFWWPVLVAPRNTKTAIFSSESID